MLLLTLCTLSTALLHIDNTHADNSHKITGARWGGEGVGDATGFLQKCGKKKKILTDLERGSLVNRYVVPFGVFVSINYTLFQGRVIKGKGIVKW